VTRFVVSGILFAVAGLIVGYLIFGRVGGELVSIQTLLQPAENVFGKLVQNVSGIPAMREKILISGAVGLGAGLLYAVAVRR